LVAEALEYTSTFECLRHRFWWLRLSLVAEVLEATIMKLEATAY
jgi:hypothetical protein